MKQIYNVFSLKSIIQFIIFLTVIKNLSNIKLFSKKIYIMRELNKSKKLFLKMFLDSYNFLKYEIIYLLYYSFVRYFMTNSIIKLQ